jgi:hypothetical protein
MTPARIDPMQRIALTARPGYVVAARAVNLAGDALRLWVSEATYDMVMGCGADGARLPRLPSHTDAPYDAIVEWSGAGGRSEVSLRGLQTVFPLLTQISRGGVLVASSRCRFAGERTLANAQAFDADGRAMAALVLGDGIAHVQADEQGLVWVGYFDEGVYGNLGWGDGTLAATPMGASGLVCFDEQGPRRWAYEAPDDADAIDDCYALNVAPGVVWTHYYSSFPFVQIRYQAALPGAAPIAFGTNAWCTNAEADAPRLGGPFATDGRIALMHLGGAAGARLVAKGHIMAPHQQVTFAGVDGEVRLAVGRGSTLHLLTDDAMHAYSLYQQPPDAP